MLERVCRFAEALRSLLGGRTPVAFEERWRRTAPDDLGWEVMARAWQRDHRDWEPVLHEVDGLLLRLLDQVPIVAAGSGGAADRVRTFRRAELERLQHATAAALVAQRYGVAGLRTVIDDDTAPLPRRYFAFFALAERHPPGEWRTFRKQLRLTGHHAFVGAAVEAARFYPRSDAAERLLSLFGRIRGDVHFRSFLSPRILESLFVLQDPVALPLFRDLLSSGYTDRDPQRCEVLRSLVFVRRMTGSIELNVKYPDDAPGLPEILDRAERAYVDERAVLHPVVVI